MSRTTVECRSPPAVRRRAAHAAPCRVSHARLLQVPGNEHTYGRRVPKKTCQASSDLAIKLKSM